MRAMAREEASFDMAEAVGADPYGAFLSRCPYETPCEGLLTGLRVAVKDNIAVEGQPFTAGIPLFSERISPKNAAVVSLLKKAGATISGLTVTDAAGFGVLTPTVKNPARDGYTVGGSSGGAAAAVAADFAQVGLGTDTGGSVRIPAACCGLFGFKPSHGLLSTDGVWPLAPSFDTIGFMAREMRPLEKVLQSLLGWKEVPSWPGRLRLGVDPRRMQACDEPVLAALEGLWLRLRDENVELHPIDFPEQDDIVRAHATIVLSEARMFYAQIWRKTPNMLPKMAQSALRIADHLTEDEIAAAWVFAEEAKRHFAHLLQQVDALASPTMPILPPAAGARRVNVRGVELPAIEAMTSETCLANVVGGPAFSMPSGDGEAHFVGLQINSVHGKDADVFAIGKKIASALRRN
jgi:Asp-tRNA(Asn)/Glu-tRNA(Gln) amidotransferase A subunit family amidase